MVLLPPRARHRQKDGPFQSLHSYLVFPLPSPSLESYSAPVSSASSTTCFHGHDSTLPLPQFPRPAVSPSSSSSSMYSSFLGRTACGTPSTEAEFTTDFTKNSIKEAQVSINTFQKKYDPETCTIETLHEHDDIDLLSTWKRKLYRLSPLITFLSVAAYFLYYGYRIHCTIEAQEAYHKIYAMAWLFIAAEGAVACKW
jgi:hypothetical protein